MHEELASVYGFAALLAIVQGVVEFLPISSSGHLVLLGHFAPQDSLVFHVAVHLGSLCAVLLALRHRVSQFALQLPDFLSRRAPTVLLDQLAIATLPLVILVALLPSAWLDGVRTIEGIAIATIVFAVPLWLADMVSRHPQRFRPRVVHPYLFALWIGLWQCFAIIPGASRSGLCLTAALFAGQDRRAAAEFVLLLSIPAILGATAFAGVPLLQGEAQVDWGVLLWGFALSLLVARISIAFLLHWVARHSLLIFVVYRLLLGGVILWALS